MRLLTQAGFEPLEILATRSPHRVVQARAAPAMLADRTTQDLTCGHRPVSGMGLGEARGTSGAATV